MLDRSVVAETNIALDLLADLPAGSGHDDSGRYGDVQMLRVIAEFERGMIRERILAELFGVRSQGKHLGRALISTAKTRAVREALLVGGTSLRRIAAEHHVGLGSVQRLSRVLLSGPNRHSR